MTSFKQSITRMNDLALSLVDKMNLSEDRFSDDDKNRFWAIADGLTARYYMDVLKGRVSLDQLLNNPIEDLEKNINDSIKFLKRIEKILR